ncbi:MAG: LysR family transcriptional regulator [Rhodospirillales bacterium]
MDSIGDMAVFARVVEAESFSEAARRLGISKSAASKQVSRLEDRLGARLLNRTTRSLSLTDAGADFYDRASRILADLEEAEQAVSSLQAAPRGRLRVNAPMSFGIRQLGPILPSFTALCPELRVDLELTDRYCDIVEEGFDMALRIAELPDSTLIAKRLAPARRAIVASPDYWDRHGRPQHPSDLADHPCLMYSLLQTGADWTFKDGIRVRVDGPIRANNGDVLRGAVLAGQGVCLAPTFMVGDDLRAGRLEAVLCDYEDDDRNLYAVWPQTRYLAPKVRAFVDFLLDAFQPEPPWDKGLRSGGKAPENRA